MLNTSKINVKDKFERLHIIGEWAAARYTINGRLVLYIGANPSAYTRIIDAAFNKYL